MRMSISSGGRSGKAGPGICGRTSGCEVGKAGILRRDDVEGGAGSKCLTAADGTASDTMHSHVSVVTEDEYFCRNPRWLLTSYNNVCTCVKIYRQRTDGASLMQGGGMKAQIVRKVLHAVVLACLLCPMSALAENAYVGTAACKDCHEEQYDNFTKYAKKAHSDRSIKIMASDLSEAELAQCYGCHTTGYGKPGGFVSYEKTPHVADAGCEVCHGPGQEHVESGGDTELIKGKLTMEDCQGCHNESRVKAFNFKPLLYGGAH